VARTFVFRGLLFRTCGRRNFMKNPAEMKNRQALWKLDRQFATRRLQCFDFLECDFQAERPAKNDLGRLQQRFPFRRLPVEIHSAFDLLSHSVPRLAEFIV
jgi:hypothetical protein